jgi:16S rRNA (cytosine967-C5)-methyltransferase
MTDPAPARPRSPDGPSPARAAAARVLERVEADAAFADIALEAELTRRALDTRDAALATELVFGTLRWQRYLDWVLAPHSHRPFDTLDVAPRVLLRMAAYQMVFLERVPAFAAVSDAVTLARGRGQHRMDGFVNAVLRAFLRRGRREPQPPADYIEALAVRWSFPTWLAARWIARHGDEEAIALMRALNERPPLTIRTNTLQSTRDELAERLLREEHLHSRPASYAPEGLLLEHAGAPAAWRAFRDGAFAVQDEASILVSRLLAPVTGETIADTCAAPGTKTTHLAQLMDNRGRLLAFDPQPARLARVNEAAARLGVRIIESLGGTAEALAPRFAAACDGVLVDAPCSNLGVLRRNPEVKWRRQPGDLVSSAERQRSVLEAAATMVKPGGRLVYATCSLEPEENDDVARAFLAGRPDFRVDAPAEFPIPLDGNGMLRCLPHRHGTDGFTAVRFRRGAA